jgi:hypothetical protein
MNAKKNNTNYVTPLQCQERVNQMAEIIQKSNEAIGNLNVKMEVMVERQKGTDEKIDTQNRSIESLIKKIDDLPGYFDERYASKIVEKIVYAAAGMILTAVFGALIYLVIVH